MGFTYFLPEPSLQHYIENIIIVNLNLNEDFVKEITIVPDYRSCLCFILDDKISVIEKGQRIERDNAIFASFHLFSTIMNLGQKHRAVCVQFKPIGWNSLMGNVPQNELLNNCYDAKLFLGSYTNTLTERLAETSTAAMQNHIIQSFLKERLSKLKMPSPFDKAINTFIQSSGKLSIEETASLSCLSLRQFERQCNYKIGVSPRMFGRLIRFSNAYKAKEQHPNMSWNKIAFHCGYFDHMHLIRDFKQFSGTTPSITEDEDHFRSFPYDRANNDFRLINSTLVKN
ncbi:helix-turn-helix domain-containing protein [Pedobacter sp. LMG 31464]|uniref:Helix-turn-helix domain-containing protein n=1 Tax=Pedobacter planticolens TaxID=2679964 RepID=A0A923IYB0_9SPHI|nr:AraC family transcriptional regulator [Pedobacter planticolens]MBB2147267.1 helix-turn-helix domain-containing protein [Pedobacter planticolens]